MTDTGRRVVVDAYGETPLEAIANHLRVVEQVRPDPADLAPDDVVIRVRSCAVGWVDLLMTSGQYQHMPKPPYTPGLEYAGDVEWVGPAVEHVSVGDRVLADGFETGPRSGGSHERWGGFATWSVAPARGVKKLSDKLTYDQGTNLLGNYETAYHCLIACGDLQAGETVLIHGASGNTGLAAVHLARLLGATVIATGRNPAKLEIVRQQGAHHTIVSTDGFKDRVKELTGGRGVDVVYDGVGGPISVESLRCVKFGARFLIVGWAATPFVARGKGKRGAPNANVLPTNLIMMKGLKVMGCPTVISTQKDPSIRIERSRRIDAWVESGDVKPYVGPIYALTDVVDAMKAKWTSQFVGGCVLHP